MNFTAYQLTLLALRGIKPARDLHNGTIQCSTAHGERYYTASDLVQLAKPGFMDRLTAWMNQGVAS